MDVMLAVGDTANADGPAPTAQHFKREIKLNEHVSIGPLDHALREAILNAGERRGLNCAPAYRQYGSVYALIRCNAPRGAARRSCDPDNQLSRVAAILRLARPHSLSLGQAARVITQPDGRMEICPASPLGPGSHAFVLNTDDSWIRDQDVVLGQQLLASLESEHPRGRIQWAILIHELIHWQSNVEVRWQLLCTCLEGLVHTDDRGQPGMRNRDQFVVRLSAIRELVPALDWSPEELNQLYDHRNQTMHGGDIRKLWALEPFPALYRKAEMAFRAIICAAILRSDVSDVFESDAALRALGN